MPKELSKERPNPPAETGTEEDVFDYIERREKCPKCGRRFTIDDEYGWHDMDGPNYGGHLGCPRCKSVFFRYTGTE